MAHSQKSREQAGASTFPKSTQAPLIQLLSNNGSQLPYYQPIGQIRALCTHCKFCPIDIEINIINQPFQHNSHTALAELMNSIALNYVYIRLTHTTLNNICIQIYEDHNHCYHYKNHYTEPEQAHTTNHASHIENAHTSMHTVNARTPRSLNTLAAHTKS